MNQITITILSFFLLMNIGKANNPTISCPGNISMDAAVGACGQVVTFEVTSGGTCPGETISQSVGLPSGATFPVGTTTNTFIVSDSNGNMDECSFEVTIIDNQAPAFVCLSDTTLVAPPSTCGMVVNYGMPPFISDNCNANSIVLQHNNSNNVVSSFTCDSMSVSSHLRVFELSSFGAPSGVQVSSVDIGIGFAPNNPSITVNLYSLIGNLSYANMTLIASETITVPSLFNTILNVPLTASIPMGTQLVAELIVPEFSSGNTVPGYNNGIGQTAPSYIFSAACGHTDPVDLAALGEPDFSLVLMVNTSNVVMEQTGGLPSGATFPVGTTTNTFQVTDAAGNSATCSFNVNILDQQVPLLVCPTNIQMPATAGACGAVVDFEVFAVENCSNETINIVEGLPSGAFFPIGNTLNVFAVNDGSGNVDTCRFDVTILDMEAPTIICPNDIIQGVMGNNCHAVVNYNIATEDNCSEVTLTQINGLPSGFEFPVGTITNTFVATDEAGLKDTCSFTITVVDDTLPELTFCPEDITVSNDAGSCEAVVEYDEPMFLDDCSIINYSLKQNLSDAVTSSYGCTNGGASSHIRVFSLNSMGVAGALEVDSVKVGIGFADGNPEVSLNLYLLSGDLTYANMIPLASTSANIPNTFNGTYTFPIYTPVQAGATLVAELVIPTGTNAPFIAGYNEGGEIVSTYYAASNCGQVEPVALSEIGISNISLVLEVFGHGLAASTVTQISGLASGSVFPMGTTNNIYQVMDAAGNSETCSFDITVTDTEAPILDCIETISVSTMAASCDTMLLIPAPTFTDNCMGTVSITNDYTNAADANGLYNAGVTIITWTASDAQGNQSTCQTSVEVMASGLGGDLTASDNTACFGETPNGLANINITTGAEPITYTWSNGATSPMIEGLSGGIYTVTVSDASGCQFIGDVQINEATPLLIVDGPVIVNATQGSLDGSIDITIEGGTPPFSYVWTDGSTTEDLLNIAGGIYGVTVSDANNCTAILTDIIVDEMVSIQQPAIVQTIALAPNPTNGIVYIDVLLNETASLNIQVLNNLGQKIESVQLRNNKAFQQVFDTANWTAGIYFVQCIINEKEVVTQKLMVIK